VYNYGFERRRLILTQINLRNLEVSEEGTVLKELGNYAFGGAGVTSIEFPPTVLLINRNEFRNSSELQNESFSACNTMSLYHIAHAVIFWTGIKSVVIPRSVSSMDSHAFAYTAFAVNGSLRYIAQCTFQGTYLTSVEIPH
jgi:hypothetical protein